jgi:hypothetical protein
MTCTCCGQTIKAPKATTPVEPIDTTTLSEKDAYAYFKKTAPVEDAKFLLRSSLLTPELRAELESLIARPPARSEFYRRYIRVNDAWRELANVAHLARIAAEPATEEAA